MKTIHNQIKETALLAIQNLYPEHHLTADQIIINDTKPEFEGEYTLVIFPFVKLLKANPAQLGKEIAEAMKATRKDLITDYTIVGGFINFKINEEALNAYLISNANGIKNEIFASSVPRKIMIEYSSPNTNKPIHFGHLRNNFLGWSVSQILKLTGHDVIMSNLVNDRGIHICKSMIAWQRYADGATPQSSGIKGDHFVGDYYVKYNDIYKEEMLQLIQEGMSENEAEKNAPIFLEAQEMLRKWEAGDEDIYNLWKKMNSWVYEGFDVTYQSLGLHFDKYYYESDTYLLGKKLVQEGLEKGILFQKENGSIWIDLKDKGLDEKLLLRADGTSVYMTQDLGTAKLKYDDFGIDTSVYVIADEQNYHMQVLKAVLEKLGEPSATGLHHLSYGMVELPSGRMKSREGTVVDADDMISEMIRIAKEQTETAGKTEGFSQEELEELYRTIGLGALKFYLLRVDPKKKMIFDPKESIDLHGFTAAFIQYSFARIQSILRKNEMPSNAVDPSMSLLPMEKKLLVLLEQYPTVVTQASDEYNPSVICNYIFRLAQMFNSFYEVHSISKAENENKKMLRLALSKLVSDTIAHAMNLLGINVPERM